MTDTQPRRIEYMALADLAARRDPENVKGHAEADIDASVERFGYTEPVVLDERTGKLVAGHGRIEALLRAQPHRQRPPDGVLLVGEDWEVPVVRGWGSTSEAEAKAYMIAANRTTELGGWTEDLPHVLAELATGELGLPPGFTADDLDDLLVSLGAGELPEQPTAAAHADDLSNRGDAAAPRQTQGLHEVGLMFQHDARAEFDSLLAQLRRRWQNPQMPTPMVVLRALRQALHYDGTEDGE